MASYYSNTDIYNFSIDFQQRLALMGQSLNKKLQAGMPCSEGFRKLKIASYLTQVVGRFYNGDSQLENVDCIILKLNNILPKNE